MYIRLKEVEHTQLNITDLKIVQHNIEQKVKKRKDQQGKKQLLEILLSFEFGVVFVVSFVKCGTCFIYGSLFKEIGIYMVKDDLFVTISSTISMVFSILIRFGMGRLTDRLGIKSTYYLNLAVFLMANSCMTFFGRTKSGFLASLCINRTGQSNQYLA